MRPRSGLLACLLAATLLAADASPCPGQAHEAFTRPSQDATLSSMPTLDEGNWITWYTRPSQDVSLSFLRPGRIQKVLVKEGQLVKPGQTLVQLDDAVEQAELARLKAQAEDTTRIRAAQASLEQKRAELKKKEVARAGGAATELEVEIARLEVIYKELSLELEQFERDQQQRKYLETKLQVERMRLVSPIAGRVEKIALREGECADALEDVIRVVNDDSLWVDVPVPPRQVRALNLAVGGTAEVMFPAASPAVLASSVEGKIIFIAATTDSAGGRQTVRVEVTSRGSSPAGEYVKVSFPAGGAAASPTKPLDDQKE